VDDQGLAGIELRFDEAIRGRPGELLIQRDARRRWFGRTGKPPTPGEDLVLTIDETIQSIAERELDAVMAASRAISGTVLVEDPHSGEILAMASRPTFNPNTYAEASEAARRNLAVSGIYEPGSTFKIVTIASALEEGLASPGERLDCQMGSISVFGHTIRDHKAFGILTVGQAFENSSDVCAIKIALRLGNDGLYKYLRRFGFGSPTGIELPGEARGLTKPPERWWKASIGAIAMGQEIGATPLQVLAAASTVANDGVWVRPRVVLERSSAGLPPEAPVRDAVRVVSPRTAARMQDMMVKVVTDGTGKTALPKGYSAGGKTGTAQKLDPLTKRYSARDYIASFVGFAPAEDPLVTILVVLDSPRGRYHGGDVAAPVFRAVAEQVLAYRNVPPTAPQPLPLSLASWKEPAAPLNEEVVAEGEGTVPLETQAGGVVPNFLGQSVRAITAQAAARGLPIQIVGYGVAYEQSPLPGMVLEEGQTIVVRFATGLPANRPPRRREAPEAGAPRPPSAQAVSSPASG
jgi:cell division protein FtsI (penicillin-binding protein 3)